MGKNNISIVFPIIVTSILYLIQLISTIKWGFSEPGIKPRQRDDYFMGRVDQVLDM